MISYRLLGPQTWGDQIAACEILETSPGCETIENGYIVAAPAPAQAFVMSDDGKVITGSRTTRYEDPIKAVVSQDRKQRIVRGVASTDNRVCVFLGGLFPHFGHFLLESLSRLWYSPDEDVVYAVAPGSNVSLRAYMRVLWKYAGLDLSRLIFVTETMRFRRIIVPEPGFRIGRHASMAMRPVYQRIGQGANPVRRKPHRRIYMSRTGWETSANERELEVALSAIGFEILHPQDLSIEEQIAAASEAEHIVGRWGSAMHLVLFSQPDTRITHLFADKFFASFFLTDQLALAKATYVLAEPGSAPRHGPGGAGRSARNSTAIDIDRVLQLVT